MMSFRRSLGYSVLHSLIEDMTLALIPTVELVLYDYLRCNLIEYTEFLALMEFYRFSWHKLDSEES